MMIETIILREIIFKKVNIPLDSDTPIVTHFDETIKNTLIVSIYYAVYIL